MSCNIRCRSNQCLITDSANLYDIVTDKTVSTFNQFQCSFTLTDSTFTHDQHTDTVYINQHTMNRNAWCKLHIQPSDDLCCKFRCLLLCLEYRDICLFCHLQKHLFRWKIPAEDQTRNLIRKQCLINPLFLIFICHLLQKCIFYITNDLYTFRIKMFKKSRQLQCRSVNIWYLYIFIRQIYIRC